MKRIIIISLLNALIINTGLAAAQPERRIQSLAERCRDIVAQDPNFIHNVLPVLHEKAPGCEGIIVPARRINTALLNRISLQSRVLGGHTNAVNSVAFSPDGTTLASGSSDNTVRLWDTKNGTCLHTLQGHTYQIASVAFSPDGTTLASASSDSTVRLWDTATGTHLHTLQGHTDQVSSIAFSPDGTTLASASDDSTVRLWDTTTLLRQGYEGQAVTCLNSLQNDTIGIFDIAFSPDGTTLASASLDNIMRLWDTRSGACLHTLHGHTYLIASVAFSPDGTTLASASYDGTVRLWDTQSGACLHTLQGHTNRARSVAFSPDGTTLASASSDNTVRLWDTRSGACRHTLEGHAGWVNSVAFSPDGTTLASASWDCTVRLWTDYQKDLQKITDIDEQRFLLEAAENWLANQPHQVSANNPIYLRLIERFPFLNNPLLFTVIQPNEHTGIPTCSSSGNTPASSSEQTEQPTMDAPENNAAPIIEAQQLAAPALAPTFWQQYRTPIIATGLTAAACALGAYLWNRYASQ